MATKTAPKPAAKAEKQDRFSYTEFASECEAATKWLNRGREIMDEHGNIDKMSKAALAVIEDKGKGRIGLKKEVFERISERIERIKPYAKENKDAASALEAAKETVETAKVCMGLEKEKTKGRDRE